MTDTENTVKKDLLAEKNITKVKVRFNDTDAMGVVHFKNYMVYFDDGFVSFMNMIKTNKPVEQAIHDGYALGVKHVDITYEGSAIFGDYVVVETTVKEVGNKSITFHHELSKESDNTLLATVDAVRFVLDLKTKKLINILDFFEYFLN